MPVTLIFVVFLLMMLFFTLTLTVGRVEEIDELHCDSSYL
jgi:hypothetical protein